jgi:hypothetical protein
MLYYAAGNTGHVVLSDVRELVNSKIATIANYKSSKTYDILGRCVMYDNNPME